ncbi:hypothetical protein M758_UG010900 [Ceratodon purpureus]|nr:hypothetical protein M758_UG010900 [Ceratodon purpureus]
MNADSDMSEEYYGRDSSCDGESEDEENEFTWPPELLHTPEPQSKRQQIQRNNAACEGLEQDVEVGQSAVGGWDWKAGRSSEGDDGSGQGGARRGDGGWSSGRGSLGQGEGGKRGGLEVGSEAQGRAQGVQREVGGGMRGRGSGGVGVQRPSWDRSFELDEF